MEVSARVRVARPRPAVFAAWAALERAGEYSDTVIERRKVTDGPTSRGTRFAAIDRWPGRDVAFTVEVTDFDPPGRMAAVWSEPLTGGWDAIFEDVDGDTELTFHASVNPGGLLRLLGPFLRPWVARQTTRSLAAFRAWVESGAAAG